MSSQLNEGQDMQSQGQGVAATDFAMQQAKFIAAMDPSMQQLAVANIRANYGPEIADLIVQALAAMGVTLAPGGGQPGQELAGPQLDTRPLPEQRAPRRDTPSV